MRSFLMFTLVAFLSQAEASQQGGMAFDLGAMAWRALVGGKCTARSNHEPGMIGKYAFDCDGGAEDFPRLNMQNNGPSDWRGFNLMQSVRAGP